MKKRIVRSLYDIKASFAKIILTNRRFDPNHTLIITSDPRSGSTWLMQAIQSSQRFVCFWEPLHLTRGVFHKKFNFGWNPSLQSDVDLSELKMHFDRLFSGQLCNEWVCQKMHFTNVFRGQNLLIKFVRANLLLPWLVDAFDFQYKPIYLLRHPIPTCLSQIKNFRHENFQLNETRPEYQKYAEIIIKYRSPLEQKLIQWCIQNTFLLRHPMASNRWVTVYYELLLSNPTVEFRALYDQVGIQWDENILKKIHQPSSSDFNRTYQHDMNLQLSKWRGELCEKDMMSAQEILDYFKISQYTINSDLPVLEVG